MNFKKLVFALSLVLFITAFGFAGGEQEMGTGEPVASASEAGTPGAPIKIRGLIGAWNTMASTVEERKDFYERRMLEWAKNHPDVYVEIEVIPGGQTAQAMTKLITAALAGNPHDFANVDSQWVGNFHEAGVLQPIDEFLDPADQYQFFDFTKMVTQRNGKQYSLWAETGLLLYYFNKNYAPTAPKTWDDLFALSEKLQNDKAGVTPFLTQGKGAAAAFCMLPHFWAQGGILFDPNDNFRPVFGEGKNKTAMVNTLNFYKELVDSGATPPEIVGYEHKELQAEAQAGNVATMIAGSWVYNQLDPAGWSYTSLPVPEAGDQPSNIYGGWTFSFLAKDKKKLEAAVDFVKEVYTDQDAMAERLPLHGYIPTRKDVFNAPAFNSDFYQQIYKELETGRARPATSLYPEVESLIEEAIGKIVSGNQDVETIVDQMYEKVLTRYNDM